MFLPTLAGAELILATPAAAAPHEPARGRSTAGPAESRCELTRSEHDVMSHRVSEGVHVLRRLLGSRVGMHPHLGEVVGETLFHVLPYCGP